jgi:tetratricopeptide (TPR) repeat protein
VTGGRIEPGSRFGDLVIERVVGTGAFGSVYLARDTLLRRQVALKVFAAPGGAMAESERNRILAEARIIGRLNSPHVVTLYRVHPGAPGGWMFEMEYVEGGSLDSLLAEDAHPHLQRGLEVLRGIAAGLKAAHDAGIVHGDIKPANVLLDQEGTPKLADFGLAHLLHEQSLSGDHQGDLVGTPLYMAPEVIMGERPVPASDIWSFGVILYRLLAGRLPFDGPNLHALFLAIQNAPPPPLHPGTPPELAQLAQRCLAKAAAQRPPGFGAIVRVLEKVTARGLPPAAESVRAPPEAPTLYGREREIAQLHRLLERTAAGAAAAVLLTGEAGVGKTALLRQLGATAYARGFMLLEVRVSPVEGLLRPLLAELRLHVSAGTLGERLDASGAVLENVLRQDVEALETRQQLVWAVERLLDVLAADRPLCLVVEDAHGATPEELQLIAELASRLAGERILLAVAYRLHAGGATPGGYRLLTARDEFEPIALSPIAAESVLRILEDAAGVSHLAPEVSRRITGLAEGNPLFAKELLRHLREQGAVVEEEDTLRPGPAWGRASLPRRIRDLVTHRLQGLPEEERAVLDVAAVDGMAFDGQAVAAALDLPLLRVLRQLQRLYRASELVLPQPSGYHFAHPLLHELIYDDIAPALRTALHRKLAEHLESRGADAQVDPERLGQHWEKGGQLERARPYLLAAAVAAEKRQELSRTIDLCTRAGLFPGRTDPATALRHQEALTSLAICLSDAGRHEEAEEVFGLLLEAAAQAGDETLRYRTIVQRTKMLYPVKGVEVVDEAELVRATEVLALSRMLGLAHYNLGILAKRRGDLEEAQRRFEEAEGVYGEVGDEGRRAAPLNELGVLAAHRGEVDRAEQLYSEAVRLSASVGRRVNAAIFEVNKALLAFSRGRLEGLEAALDRSIRILELRGFSSHAHHAALVLAYVHYSRGEVESARTRVREVRRKLEEGGPLSALVDAHLVEADLATIGGRLRDGSRSLASARATAEKCRYKTGRILTAALEAQRLCFAGDHEGAAREAGAALTLGAGHTDVTSRSELICRLAEATLHGLPVEILTRALQEPKAPSGFALAFARGAVEFRSASDAAASLHAGADALMDPHVGERRAVLRATGHWLRAEALQRQGEGRAAEQEALNALEGAHALGHVWLEAQLLDQLYRWTGDRDYRARREALLQRTE